MKAFIARVRLHHDVRYGVFRYTRNGGFKIKIEDKEREKIQNQAKKNGSVRQTRNHRPE
jgi:hypothetical protein